MSRFKEYPEKLIHFLRSPIGLICLFGLALRIIFILFGAKIYFGRENIYVDGDTWAWANSFQNLLETGTYTTTPGLEYGPFGRMPGYSFFMGFFYLLTGHNWERAYVIIAWVQLFLDVWAIYLMYRICRRIFTPVKVALIAAFLYASYPFIIVWDPLVYSELIAVVCLLFSLDLLLSGKKYAILFSALFLAFGVLCRPQLLLIVPFYGLYILVNDFEKLRWNIKKALLFTVIFSAAYGIWPLRNYVNYHKIILTQDTRGFYNWNEDVVSFMQYVFAIKAEWDPQYSDLIANRRVIWPAIAYRTTEDSVKLERAVWLSQNCGSGFSHKRGYWGNSFDSPHCNGEIKALFTELRENQVKYNPLNFYVKVPLKNLQKALFKTKLTDQASMAKRVASLLFYYRTLLILLGFAGVILMARKRAGRNVAFMILLYFCIVYLLLCAGTSVQMRNIEMRYFLPPDILMLIPAAFLIHFLSALIPLPSFPRQSSGH